MFICLLLSSCQAENNIEKTELATLKYFAKNRDAAIAAKYLIDNSKDRYGLKTSFITVDGIDKTFEVLNYSNDKNQSQLSDLNVHANIVKVYDTIALNKNFLIQNIKIALEAYEKPIIGKPKWYDWSTFCEYVLPYRIGVELLNDWRPYFHKRYTKYLNTFDTTKLNISEVCNILKRELEGTSRYTFWFENNGFKPSINQTVDEILTYRTPFSCEDYVIHSTYVLRSLGIPTAIEIIPYWGKFNFGHMQEAIMFENLKFYPNTPNDTIPFLYQIAKMYRKTFTKVKNPLDEMLGYGELAQNIPKEFNYDDLIDITKERTAVSDIKFSNEQLNSLKTAYLCVYNNGVWKPVDWAQVIDGKVSFRNVGRNILYHIASYSSNKLHLINTPFLVNTKGDIEELGSRKYTDKLILTNWDRQNYIEVGGDYKLYSWNIKTNSWTPLLIFNNSKLPLQVSLKFKTNTNLYKLEPLYKGTLSNVRPFTYKNGKQIWW